MKKQASDQQFHDRRYQERKRAEAARVLVKKKSENEGAGKATGSSVKETTKQ
jgi:hypothetical protein